MPGKHRLTNAFRKFKLQRPAELPEYSGLMGLTKGGEQLVEVPNRAGYVYVRLRSNLSEVVVVYNDKVSPVYDLPVLVSRNQKDKNRWYLVGKDTGRYGNWGSTAYTPKHGDQHSFSPSAPGGDIVWVYGEQFAPLGSTPSGSSGAGTVMIQEGFYYINGTRFHIDTQDVGDLLGYRPSGTNARMVLIYVDGNEDVLLVAGNEFSSSITGTNNLAPYVPQIPGTGIASAAVRLVSGTTAITWDNLVDYRPFFSTTSGTASANAGHIIQDDGVDKTARSYLNFVGSTFVLYDDGTATIVSGTASGGGGGGDIYWSIPGALASVTGAVPSIVVGHDLSIEKVYLYADNPGITGSTVIDILKNGTSIFTAKPTLPFNDADKKVSVVPTTTSAVEGDVLYLNLDAVATESSDATICIVVTIDAAGGGDMLKSIYDTNNDGVVDNSSALETHPASYFSISTHVHTQQVIFTIEGDVEIVSGLLRIPNHTGRTLTIAGVYLDISTAPVSASLIADIHKNGTTIFTNQANRPQITSGNTSGNTTTIDVPSWADGAYLTLDIDAIGTSTPGSDLVVTVVYS